MLCALFITMLLIVTGTSLSPLTALLGPIALNGVFTATAYTTHYRALELGPVAVVSPIGDLVAVIGVALAMILLDERPTPMQLLGAGVTVVGVALVSTDLRALRAGHPVARAGTVVGDRLRAGLRRRRLPAGYVAQRAGWVAGLWGSRMAQMACLVPVAAVGRREVSRVATAGALAVGLALSAGAADILGVTSFSAGAEHG